MAQPMLLRLTAIWHVPETLWSSVEALIALMSLQVERPLLHLPLQSQALAIGRLLDAIGPCLPHRYALYH